MTLYIYIYMYIFLYIYILYIRQIPLNYLPPNNKKIKIKKYF
jgi:hypothetical protein